MITQLRLFQLRNFLSLTSDFEQNHIALYGENGSGKTTILEAISLFMPGRGLCSSDTKELISDHTEDKRWYVQVIWKDQEDLDVKAVTGYNEQKGMRIHTLQGSPIKSLTEFQNYFQIVWLTPEHDRLFLDSPSKRRRFLDRLIPTQDHYNNVMRFEHLAKERLKVLRTLPNPVWLDSLEDNMDKTANLIIQARKNLLNSINSFSDKITPFEACFVEEMDDNLKESLKRSRIKDSESGRTSAKGPHNLDWTLYYKGRPAHFGSTGEQKSLLMSFFFAYVNSWKEKTKLILLLDDMLSHLDEKNRSLLCENIKKWNDLQVWMTSTEKDHFKALNTSNYYVHDGQVTLI